METYSTKEAAKQVGIHWVTLLRWQADGKVSASQQLRMNGGKHWRWTAKDIVKLRKYKKLNFRKGQGRRSEHVGKTK